MHARKLAAILIMLAITPACKRLEPPRTAGDSMCLIDRRISAEPAPVEGMDDAGNLFDSEATFGEILEHNAAYARICGKP